MTLSKIYVNNQPYFLFTDFENGLAVSLTNGCDVYHGKGTYTFFKFFYLIDFRLII